MGPDALSDLRYERQRRELIEVIRAKGIDDLEVLGVFDAVPRHSFVPEAVRHRAYEDAPLPIGFGQTASQPSLQALYLTTLRIGAGDRVLEVGTGSGYQTALLARLAAHVYSIDRVRELSARARSALDRLRVDNVALLVGDGTVGWSRYAPYDAILVAAAAPSAPTALLDQLAPGGRMLAPVGDRREQRLVLYRRTPDGVETEEVTRCTFVPLIGRFGVAGGDVSGGEREAGESRAQAAENAGVLRRLYDWVLSWAETRYGPAALAVLAFAESSFFPIPPDPLLLALALGAPRRALRFAGICAAALVAGGLAGYAIGLGLWTALDSFFYAYVPGVSPEAFEAVRSLYDRWDFWAIFVAGFTPIPYKVFTLSAGAFQISLPVFIVASTVSRSARFFLIAGLIRIFGPGIHGFIDRYFDRLVWLFFALLVGGFLVIEFVL